VPIPPVQQPTVNPAVITLTGITTILGDKRALLKIHVPAKPPAPAREAPCILKEGQSEGEVQVLAINEATWRVKVSNAGNIEVLTFEKNGPKVERTFTAQPSRGARSSPRFPPPIVPSGTVRFNQGLDRSRSSRSPSPSPPRTETAAAP